MAHPNTWLPTLAWIKALHETTKNENIDLYATFEKYYHDPETIQEAQRVSAVFSTYSEEEVQALLQRIQGCRDRFIQEGGGFDRTRCICSVLNQASEGNGGNLPLIDDWENIYKQLKCDRFITNK